MVSRYKESRPTLTHNALYTAEGREPALHPRASGGKTIRSEDVAPPRHYKSTPSCRNRARCAAEEDRMGYRATVHEARANMFGKNKLENT